MTLALGGAVDAEVMRRPRTPQEGGITVQVFQAGRRHLCPIQSTFERCPRISNASRQSREQGDQPAPGCLKASRSAVLSRWKEGLHEALHLLPKLIAICPAPFTSGAGQAPGRDSIPM